MKDQRGAAMIEAALVTPVLLLTVLAFIWLGLYIYVSSSLQFVADRAIRVAVIGSVEKLDDGYKFSPLDTMDIKLAAVNLARTLGVRLSTDEVSVCPIDNPECIFDFKGTNDRLLKIKIAKKFKAFGLWSEVPVIVHSMGRAE